MLQNKILAASERINMFGETVLISTEEKNNQLEVTIENQVRRTIIAFTLSTENPPSGLRGVVSNVKLYYDFIGKGYERHMINFAENFFKNQNCTSISINMLKNNTALSGLHTWSITFDLTYRPGLFYEKFVKSFENQESIDNLFIED